MLIENYQILTSKRILVSVINYANEAEVVEFAQHLAKQTAVQEILLTVTSNKWTEEKRQWLHEVLQNLDMDVLLCDPGKNLGYLNGCIAPYGFLRKSTTLNVKWVMISNTDIEFADEYFFEKLLARQYACDVGCVAPNVYVPTTKAYENPRYTRRFTKRDLKKRIKVFSSPAISGVYQRLGAIKAGRARGGERESQYAYLAHGCCFAVSDELANALCDIPYSALLYSEEAYVAEMAIQIGKRVYYDQALKLYHHENAVTGKLRNDHKSKMYVDSLTMIVNQFYENKVREIPYKPEDVLATIVSYNDAKNIEYNVAMLCSQNIAVLVVDNGSNGETLAKLQHLEEKYGITLLRNSENLGIATALQQGLVYAYDNKYPLYLTLDQDSMLCEGAVQEMLRVLQSDSTIASVGPAYSPEDIPATQMDARSADYLITSGSITRVNVAVCVGGFDEALFIDGVDFDFSLNLRQSGYKLAIAPGAHLKHRIGEVDKVKTLLGELSLSTHSPLRYYYLARNHVVLQSKYGKSFPKFFIKKNISMIMELAKIRMFFSEKDRYLAAIEKGRKDAKKGILGRYKGSF